MKLKKNMSVILALVICTSVCSSSIRADLSTEKTILSVDATWAVNDDMTQTSYYSNSGGIQYSVDIAGQIHGPTDFFVDENDVYVLNNSDNTISQYSNGNLARCISMDNYGVNVLKISQSDGDVFALGTDLTVTKITPNNQAETLSYANYVDGESVTNFLTINDKLYISTTELVGGKTYCFDISNWSTVHSLGYFNGRIIDDGTIYVSELNTEEDKLLGTSGTIRIERPSGEIVFIDIESDYLLGGIELVSCNSDGTFNIKSCEISQDADYVIHVDEVVRRVKANGDVIGIYAPSNQVLSVGNQTRSFNGATYQMNNLNNTFEVVELPNYFTIKEDEYISPLSEYNIPQSNEAANVSLASTNAAVYLTRDEIIANAQSYHSSFYWTCTNANLQPTTNWQKPSYVVAGTNQYMPYCWGGNDTTTSFQAGINAGGRVGNTSSANGYWLSGTYGQDCSGFVGRCWGQSSKYSTYTISQISYEISVNDLKKGDALNSNNHIILFYQIDHGDYFDLYECTTTNNYDRVANTGRYWSEIDNAYTPIRYSYVSG